MVVVAVILVAVVVVVEVNNFNPSLSHPLSTRFIVYSSIILSWENRLMF